MSIVFSDHTIDNVASIAAIAYGATIIEKHFKLDNDDSSIDNHFSLAISNYNKFKKVYLVPVKVWVISERYLMYHMQKIQRNRLCIEKNKKK